LSAAGASRPARGLLDSSVVIDLDRIPVEMLPIEMAVSALTLAQLAAGPHTTADSGVRARRHDRLQRAEATRLDDVVQTVTV
jgi:hypothetical protein